MFANEEEDVIELNQDGSGFDVSSSTQEAVNPPSSESTTPPQFIFYQFHV